MKRLAALAYPALRFSFPALPLCAHVGGAFSLGKQFFQHIIVLDFGKPPMAFVLYLAASQRFRHLLRRAARGLRDVAGRVVAATWVVACSGSGCCGHGCCCVLGCGLDVWIERASAARCTASSACAALFTMRMRLRRANSSCAGETGVAGPLTSRPINSSGGKSSRVTKRSGTPGVVPLPFCGVNFWPHCGLGHLSTRRCSLVSSTSQPCSRSAATMFF